MDTKHQIYELNYLAKRLETALRNDSEYDLMQAAQALRLFCDFFDPTWMRWSREAEKMRTSAEQLASAMENIDMGAIADFVELGRNTTY
jgi:hypothetical protein